MSTINNQPNHASSPRFGRLPRINDVEKLADLHGVTRDAAEKTKSILKELKNDPVYDYFIESADKQNGQDFYYWHPRGYKVDGYVTRHQEIKPVSEPVLEPKKVGFFAKLFGHKNNMNEQVQPKNEQVQPMRGKAHDYCAYGNNNNNDYKPTLPEALEDYKVSSVYALKTDEKKLLDSKKEAIARAEAEVKAEAEAKAKASAEAERFKETKSIILEA